MAAHDTTTWNGSVGDNDWDTDANWSNEAPVPTGTAIIDGSVDIAGGVVTDTDCQRVYIASTYTGQIGSSGTPLELDFQELSVDNTAAGEAHYIEKVDSTYTATVMVDGLKTGNALYLAGTIDKIIVEPTFIGTMHLGVSAGKTCIPKDLIMLNTTGTVDASVGANIAWASSAKIYVLSGTLLLGENIGATSELFQSGGIITVSEWTKVANDIFHLLGGVTNWNAGSLGEDAPVATTVSTLNVFGGTFSTGFNVTAQVGFTDINQYGGTINLQSSFANIEIIGDYTGYAGSYSAPKQSTTTTTPK